MKFALIMTVVGASAIVLVMALPVLAVLGGIAWGLMTQL